MPNLMPIGRFSQLCRLSIKTLRYYDEVGLLKPAEIDSWTHYRYYTLNQAVIAERIRLLRDTDMPIEEIRLLLAASSDMEAEQITARHHERLHQRLQDTQRAIALFEQFTQPQESTFSYEVQLRETNPQPIVSIRTEVLWDTLATTVSVLMQDLIQYLDARHQPWASAPVVLYHTVYDAGLDCEIGIPVATSIEENDRIKNSAIPGGLKAYTTHQGSYETLGRAYQALQGWIQAHGHDVAGPSYDIYLTGPQDTADTAHHKTECYWAIK